MVLTAIAIISLIIALVVFFVCFKTITRIYWIPVVFSGSALTLIFLWILPLIVASWFVDLKKPCRKSNKFFRFYYYCFIDGVLRLARIKIHVSGKEKLPNEQFLLVSNHKSYIDPAVAIWELRKHRIGFVGAKELLYRFPVLKKLGHKSFCIPIDRQSARDGVRMTNEAAEIINSQAASIGIYPEGQRNLDGEKLLPFKNGAFKIAQKAKCPIVVAIIKNIEKVKKNFPFRRTHVYFDLVEVLEQKDMEGYSTQEISDRIRLIFEKEIG